MEPIFLSESLHTETRRVFSRRKTASVVPRRVRTTMNHQSNPPVFLQSKKPARPTHRSECWLGEGREGKHTGKGGALAGMTNLSNHLLRWWPDVKIACVTGVGQPGAYIVDTEIERWSDSG